MIELIFDTIDIVISRKHVPVTFLQVLQLLP